MKEIEKNTVSGDNQMINSSEIYFLGNNNAKKRILVLGNSITRHGPSAEIGWEHDWGMAASSLENDYVHRLYAMLKEKGEDVYMFIRQASFWERNYLNPDILLKYKADKNFGADIIIFRLGENVPRENIVHFKSALEKLIKYLSNEMCKVVFTTCFWQFDGLDDGIRQVAKETHMPLVELGELGEDPEMKALGLFWHEGVANHPGDKGMEKIAERIFNAL